MRSPVSSIFAALRRNLRWAFAAALAATLQAQVPQIIGYQGRVVVDGVNFDSTTAGHPGVFKFALVNADGSETFWSHDGTSVAGSAPVAGVALTVTKGLYSVLLGDANPPLGMVPIGPAVFTHAEVRLRVWFDDGVNGLQLLTPDQRIAAVGYALMAGNVADGAITGTQLAPGAVGSAHLAIGAVQAGNLALGVVGSSHLAVGAVQASNLSLGAVGSAHLAAGAVQAANIAAGAVENAKLLTPSLTITTGNGLTGGGTLFLGGSIAVSIPDGGIGSLQLGPGAALANIGAGGQNLAPTGSPTFAGASLLNSGVGLNKPGLVLDRGIAPKGRLTFQKSATDPLWSGLVLSVNADWNDATGYAKDDPARSQSIFQMEYEWSELGYPVNEINWTSAGRRLWYSWGRADDYTKASVQWFAPTGIIVPIYDTSGVPEFLVEGHKAADSAVQIVVQNSNTADVSAGTQIVLRSAGTSAVNWSLGTDRYSTGADNFYIQQADAPRIFFTPTGNVGIGTTTPTAKLDVVGTVNATAFTVGGASFVAKPSESFFAADLPTYNEAPKTTAIYKLIKHLECADGIQSPGLQVYLNPSRWAGRNVKVACVVAADGTSGGDFRWQAAISYRNTPLDGISTVGVNGGDGDGTAWPGDYVTTAAPAAADAYKLLESGAFTIPSDATGLCLTFAMLRANAVDTNTDTAYVLEIRLTEQ